MPHWKYSLNDSPFRWQSGVGVDRPRKLGYNHRTWIEIAVDGTITIAKGYSWDGCSPKWAVGDWFYVGAPDGTHVGRSGKPKTYYASLVHDALYQFIDDPEMPFTRREIDLFFFELMLEADFKPRHFYYLTVRVFGRVYHDTALGLSKLLGRQNVFDEEDGHESR